MALPKGDKPRTNRRIGEINMKLYNLLTLLDPNMKIYRQNNGIIVFHDTVKGMLESAEADGAYQYALESYEVLSAHRIADDSAVIVWKD